MCSLFNMGINGDFFCGVKSDLLSVLISLGFGLASFKIHEHIKTALILTSLKNFLHPLIAFLLSKYLFQMDNLLIFIVTIAAALTSSSQYYYFSYRYNSLQNVISANIVLSTFFSFFTLSLLSFFTRSNILLFLGSCFPSTMKPKVLFWI